MARHWRALTRHLHAPIRHLNACYIDNGNHKCDTCINACTLTSQSGSKCRTSQYRQVYARAMARHWRALTRHLHALIRHLNACYVDNSDHSCDTCVGACTLTSQSLHKCRTSQYRQVYARAMARHLHALTRHLHALIRHLNACYVDNSDHSCDTCVGACTLTSQSLHKCRTSQYR